MKLKEDKLTLKSGYPKERGLSRISGDKMKCYDEEMSTELPVGACEVMLSSQISRGCLLGSEEVQLCFLFTSCRRHIVRETPLSHCQHSVGVATNAGDTKHLRLATNYAFICTLTTRFGRALVDVLMEDPEKMSKSNKFHNCSGIDNALPKVLLSRFCIIRSSMATTPSDFHNLDLQS